MAERFDGTRRQFVTSSLSTVAGLTLAGCTGSTTEEGTGGTSGTDTGASSGNKEKGTAGDGSKYSVSMAPAGEVTFEAVPETWGTYFPGYADMGVALGVGGSLTAVGMPSRYHTAYYDELDGVSMAKGDLVKLVGDSGIDKEIYYELNNDVHLTDPQWLVNNSAFGLQSKDVEEIENGVGPFVGNAVFRRTDGWHDYRYYTMYEAFEKVARVFGKVDQYEAFESFHDEFVGDVRSRLPPADERPNGVLCFAASDQPETFSPYRMDGKGTNKKQFHDLGIEDALASTDVEGLSESNRGKIDYETLLSVDPDALFVRGHETKSREKFENTVLSFMADHNVAGELTAVQNGDVYRGGPIYQGPVQNLFLTERFAANLFPDTYEGELFDRGKVADVIAGKF